MHPFVLGLAVPWHEVNIWLGHIPCIGATYDVYVVDVRASAEFVSRATLAPYVATSIQGTRVQLRDVVPIGWSLCSDDLGTADDGWVLGRHRWVTLAKADDRFLLQGTATCEAPSLLVDLFDACLVNSEAISYGPAT
jgi:hypothetical protein